MHSQAQKMREQNATIREQNTNIAELKRHVEEWDLKFAELSAKITRSREDATQNAVPPTSTQTANQLRNRAYSPPRIYNMKPNIKPRIAQVAPNSIIVNNLIENERKRKSENLLRNPASPILTKKSRIQRSDEYNPEINSLSAQNVSLFPKLPVFLSSSFEMLIKNPISSLRSRKRRMQ